MRQIITNPLRAFMLAVSFLFAISLYAVEVEIDGINYELIAKAKQATVIAKSSANYSGAVVIPESVEYEGVAYAVTSIGKSAFQNCSDLTSVTIPNSVTSIEYMAFYECSGLTSVTIGNSVMSIEGRAFYGCSGLTSVTIPNSVTSIGHYAFENCSDLATVTIGNGVTSIGDRAFHNCFELRTVVNHSNLTIVRYSEDHGEVGYHAHRIISGENLNGYYFEENNGEYTLTGFLGDETNLVLPENYKGNAYSINTGAFYDCSDLTSVAIPNSVTSIGDFTFSGCSGLTSMTIPNSVTNIGSHAFSGCSGLTSVTIPNSVTSIEYMAFNNCNGLKEVHISDIAAWCNIDFGIKANPLYYAKFLFLCDEEVKDLVIPEGVINIKYSAFSGCSGLTSVTIPNSVTNIEYSFTDCLELTDIYCYAEQVPSTASSAFEGSYVEYATLHVPDASIEDYKATAPWSGFGAIVALPAEEVELTIGTTGATTFCSEYALDFTDAEGVKAYAATGYNTETGVVTLTRVKTAKAGTGLFVVGDEGTYSIPIIDASADNSLNMLVGTTEEVTIPAVDGTYTNYIYGKSDDNTGFFKLTGDKVIPAGKAYLQIPTAWFTAVAESKIKIEFEDGTTTGIDDIEEQVRPNDGVIYDLHGRVVKNPGKGIYIVNGKKVLF